MSKHETIVREPKTIIPEKDEPALARAMRRDAEAGKSRFRQANGLSPSGGFTVVPKTARTPPHIITRRQAILRVMRKSAPMTLKQIADKVSGAGAHDMRNLEDQGFVVASEKVGVGGSKIWMLPS